MPIPSSDFHRAALSTKSKAAFRSMLTTSTERLNSRWTSPRPRPRTPPAVLRTVVNPDCCALPFVNSRSLMRARSPCAKSFQSAHSDLSKVTAARLGTFLYNRASCNRGVMIQFLHATGSMPSLHSIKNGERYIYCVSGTFQQLWPHPVGTHSSPVFKSGDSFADFLRN